jgi:hypothetical protein
MPKGHRVLVPVHNANALILHFTVLCLEKGYEELCVVTEQIQVYQIIFFSLFES